MGHGVRSPSGATPEGSGGDRTGRERRFYDCGSYQKTDATVGGKACQYWTIRGYHRRTTSETPGASPPRIGQGLCGGSASVTARIAAESGITVAGPAGSPFNFRMYAIAAAYSSRDKAPGLLSGIVVRTSS